jgi:serine/threonine protein kinase
MKRVSHYSILERIGSGGMGDVFLAEDLNLGRKVALKVLPEQFTRDAARLARFQNEARAVSALNHPNILTIHEIGESEGQYFIVTEYIAGETLRERLGRGALSVSEAVSIAEGLLAALGEAHGAGVVHRDIKPENIMVRRDGLVKVLDFGLAKRGLTASSEESKTAIRATAPGTVMGTVTYMSPEQARGLDVDARTDLFSVGGVLYEMLTGHVPFDGQTSTDILAAILHREPAPIARYGADVPQGLQWLVEKALNKERDERYQTAKEMLADLRRIRRDMGMTSDAAHTQPDVPPSALRSDPPASQPSDDGSARTISSAEYIVSGISRHRRAFGSLAAVAIAAIAVALYFTNRADAAIDSVAVLPFTNSSGDPDVEYMADGLTENVINSLSEIRELRVVPRSSVFRYKGSPLPIEQIAKELGARAILTGRLQKQGEAYTLQAELVDTGRSSQLWGQRFPLRRGDSIEVERQLAQNIAHRLRPQLTDSEQQRVERPRTTDPAAHDLYLRGRFHWNKRTATDLRKSMDFFQQAIDRDPSFALAWAGLAEALIVLPNYDFTVPANDAYPKARKAAQKALENDPSLAEARATLAGVLLEYDWNFAEGEKQMRRATELKPNYAPAHYWFADFLSSVGRGEEAMAQARAAVDADPLSLIASQMVAVVHLDAKRSDDALAALEKVEEIDPDWPVTHFIRAQALLQKGRVAEAAAEFETFAEKQEDEGFLVVARALQGRHAEADEIVARVAARAEEGEYSPFYLAGAYAMLGRKDDTFRWLERAYETRNHRMAYLARDCMFDPVRNDPRFEAMLRRIGLPTNLGYVTEWGRRKAEGK